MPNQENNTFTSIMYDYVNHGSTEDMVALGKMIADFVSNIETQLPETVHQLLQHMSYYLAPFKYRDRVEDIVSKFTNEDGTTGAHWDWNTVSKVAHEEHIEDINKFYYVLNMMYSDYYNSSFTDKDYIRMAKQFCEDKDAPVDKVIKYYRITHY